jgi:hypothetical protein
MEAWAQYLDGAAVWQSGQSQIAPVAAIRGSSPYISEPAIYVTVNEEHDWRGRMRAVFSAAMTASVLVSVQAALGGTASRVVCGKVWAQAYCPSSQICAMDPRKSPYHTGFSLLPSKRSYEMRHVHGSILSSQTMENGDQKFKVKPPIFSGREVQLYANGDKAQIFGDDGNLYNLKCKYK